MYELKFEESRCLDCNTQDCLVKCRYIKIDRERAKDEILRIARGEDSFVLHDCVTCYACEEYCRAGNHPYYLIVERQEALNIQPLPRPIVQRGINMGIPYRGEPKIEPIRGRALLMGVFADLSFLIQGRLFEGVPIISSDPRTMFHYFCQLMYLHFGKTSVIKERLPQIIQTIAAHGAEEVICFHDECYGTYSSYCPAVGIEVPFKPIHFFEYLYERLQALKGEIRPVGFKVAYQRPCSSRLSPDKHRYVKAIFELIGAVPVKRRYEDEDALCCGGTIEGQRRDGSRKLAADIQRKNIEDIKESGAQLCVFNCPACYRTLAGMVARNGIKPIFMSDLCRLAIGERPAGWR